MDTISYSELRLHLKAHMDRICADQAPLLVTRQGAEPVVMLSLAEYDSLQETLHLLADPANAAHLQKSMAQAEAGDFVEFSQESLAEADR